MCQQRVRAYDWKHYRETCTALPRVIAEMQRQMPRARALRRIAVVKLSLDVREEQKQRQAEQKRQGQPVDADDDDNDQKDPLYPFPRAVLTKEEQARLEVLARLGYCLFHAAMQNKQSAQPLDVKPVVAQLCVKLKQQLTHEVAVYGLEETKAKWLRMCDVTVDAQGMVRVSFG